MEQKINVAELLKDCPSGMELDSTIMENVYFDEVLNNSIKCFYIKNRTKIRSTVYFNKFGEYFGIENGKCVIFPKGKTTWEGFTPPCKFKDGDVIYHQVVGAVAIFNKQTDMDTISHCFLNILGHFLISHHHKKSLSGWRLATENEKQKLFDAIKANNYKWNPETKTLEKLPKFKNGDVIANTTFVAIFHKLDKIPNGISNDVVYYHCWYHKKDKDSKFKIDFGIGYASDFRFATKEEKQILFDVIKANGYKWNEETKTLEKLTKPEFKVGDEIVPRNSISNSWIVNSVSSEYYGLKLPNGSENIGVLPIEEQDDWELVPDKFDITTLKPFESKVLVRTDNRKWVAAFYSHYDKDASLHYCVVGGLWYEQCIPYEGNEHLLNTTDDCDDFYKNW